ncbi:hypothetical protein [Massilia sp. LjRoot122]|uniref:hypothetical protein n=1 Tax=Massilia sp. LjRoot122 TaxID=3342257 RepID=UPI003ECD16AE
MEWWLALITGVLSSAVVSTFITTWWAARVRRQDLQREDVKDAERLKHVYLAIATQLETFCYRCMIRKSEISEAQHMYITGEDRDALGRLRGVPLLLETDAKWLDLPVSVVDEVNTLVARYAAAGEWIAGVFQDYADAMDASDLDSQRFTYYGREASRIAKNIRHTIGQARSMHEGYDDVFNSDLERSRKRHEEYPSSTILPELRRTFASA